MAMILVVTGHLKLLQWLLLTLLDEINGDKIIMVLELYLTNGQTSSRLLVLPPEAIVVTKRFRRM